PTLFERRRCLIPYGIDQDPYFRVQRDIAPKLGYYKAAGVMSKFIPGLEGIESKMSASKPETAIFLSDPPEVAAKKVMNAFTGGQPTVREQREKGGRPEICCVFQWFKILFEPSDEALRERYERCVGGELLCGECKVELAERVGRFLRDHQMRVRDAERVRDKFLYDGRLAQRMWSWEFKY
ncbi:MAG: tryptophan--tRNA ligase, partial [Thermoprotei archaeon]